MMPFTFAPTGPLVRRILPVPGPPYVLAVPPHPGPTNPDVIRSRGGVDYLRPGGRGRWRSLNHNCLLYGRRGVIHINGPGGTSVQAYRQQGPKDRSGRSKESFRHSRNLSIQDATFKNLGSSRRSASWAGWNPTLKCDKSCTISQEPDCKLHGMCAWETFPLRKRPDYFAAFVLASAKRSFFFRRCARFLTLSRPLELPIHVWDTFQFVLPRIFLHRPSKNR